LAERCSATQALAVTAVTPQADLQPGAGRRTFPLRPAPRRTGVANGCVRGRRGACGSHLRQDWGAAAL